METTPRTPNCYTADEFRRGGAPLVMGAAQPADQPAGQPPDLLDDLLGTEIGSENGDCPRVENGSCPRVENGDCPRVENGITPIFGIGCRPEWVRRDQAQLTERLAKELKEQRPVHFLPIDTHESRRYVGGQELYVLRLFGILKNGAKAELILTDTSVDFDVRLPENLDPEAAAGKIRFELDEARIDFMEWKIVEAFPQRGVRDDPVKWCRLRFNRLKDRKDAIKLLEKEYELASDDFTNYYRKVARDENVSLAEWNVVSNYSVRPGQGVASRLVGGEVDLREPSPLCEWVIEAKCADVRPIIDPLAPRATYLKQIHEKREDPLLTRDRTLVMTYDIETYGEKQMGGPPDPYREDTEVFMICATFHWKDDPKSFLDVEIVRMGPELAARAKPPDWARIMCPNEAELILTFGRLIRRMAPDILLDFNGMQYDWPFIIEKARKHDVLGVFFDLTSAAYFSTRPQTTDNVLKWNCKSEQKVKMPNGSRHLISYLKIPGIVPCDMRVQFMKLYSKAEVTKGESLNFYLKINGLELKYDLPIVTMRKYWAAQDPEGIREIGVYCLLDSLSCQRLQTRRNIVNEARRLSSLSFVNLFDSLYYANGMKVCNKLVAHARHQFNMLYPNQTVETNEKGKKPGAFVFQPLRGIHCDFPIAGEDAGSLYPSIYIVYNLSLEKYFATRQEVEDYLATHKEYTWDDIHHSQFVFNGTERNGWFLRHQNDPAKMGLFPRILLDLFNMRKDMKVEMAKFEHRKEELEGLADEKGNLPPDLQKEYEDVVFNFNSIFAEQAAFKVFMNTFYGETGNPLSPVYLAELSAGVTSAGKRIIQKVADMTVADGHTIVYGDTDSEYPKFARRYFNHIVREYHRSKERFVKRWRKRQLRLLREKQAEERAKLGVDASDEVKARLAEKHAKELAEEEGKQYIGADGLMAAKEEYWSRLVEMAFIAAEELKQKINAFVKADNGTPYLGFAYEEVLFPCGLAGKKKYWGIPHVGRPNFRPKKLFMRGIDVVKQGQTDFAKTIGMRIMWESVSLERPPERGLLQITRDVLRDAVERPEQWKYKDFVQTAEYKPEKRNAMVIRFRERMQARFRDENAINTALEAQGKSPNKLKYIPPAPYERFRFVIVKIDELFRLQGTRRPLSKGDRIEYAELMESVGMKAIDIPFYLKAYIVGLCSRFVNSEAEFQPDASGAFCSSGNMDALPFTDEEMERENANRAGPANHANADEEYKKVDKYSIDKAKKALEDYVLHLQDINPEVLRKRGYAYRRAYKKASEKVWDIAGESSADAQAVFGGEIDHEMFLEDDIAPIFEAAKKLAAETPYSPITVADRVWGVNARGENSRELRGSSAVAPGASRGASSPTSNLYRAIQILEGKGSAAANGAQGTARGVARAPSYGRQRKPTMRTFIGRKVDALRREISDMAPAIRSLASQFDHALERMVAEERGKEHDLHEELGTFGLEYSEDHRSVFTEEEREQIRRFRECWERLVAAMSIEHQQQTLLDYLRGLRDKRIGHMRQPQEEKNRFAPADLAALRRFRS